MISIRDVTKEYGALCVLRGVSLEIPDGCIYGLAGRSGAGKSTLLRCINGLETFSGGSIFVHGVPVSTAGDRAGREFRKNIGMVFQNFSLLGRLDVRRNIALPMKCWGYSRAEIDARVRELLDLVELSDKAEAYPAQLSGGQKQRVAIARALAMRPQTLLCDEATSALDPRTADSILALLQRINAQMGITIVVVAHQLSVLRRISTRMAILEDGSVAEEGLTLRMFAEEPAALRRLRGDTDGIAAWKQANLHVMLQGAQVEMPLFPRLGAETGASFRILDTQSGMIGGKAMLSYRLQVPPEQLAACMQWLREGGIACGQIGEDCHV